MSFVSIEYAILLSVVVILYFGLSLRMRIILLLVASYIFYAFSKIEYIILIAFSTIVDFWTGRELGRTDESQKAKRRLLLTLSILVNLGVLMFFKYFNFFSESLAFTFARLGYTYEPITHPLILPVGISFYTFQSMAYTIDVYRGKIDVEEEFIAFATYVAFFPQLVAGPIERAQNILPQLRFKSSFDYDRSVSGLRLILWGLFKKVVIADRLSVYVNTVYNDVNNFNGLPLIVATVFFTFQIYCDFSGYSDIAIGSARIFGIDLMENFRQPYFATSIRDFWRRWHISLSTWFRDYLYIPLGGNRIGSSRLMLNLLIVFVASGLWHGAKWTFVIWGAVHGFVIILEIVLNQLYTWHLNIWLSRTITFIVVMFAWIFFRANSLEDAGYIIAHLFDFSQGRAQLLIPMFNLVFDPRIEYLILFSLIVLLVGIEYLQIHTQIIAKISKFQLLRWGLYYVAALFILITLLVSPLPMPFIYFQF